jgi:predicted secreted protein
VTSRTVRLAATASLILAVVACARTSDRDARQPSGQAPTTAPTEPKPDAGRTITAEDDRTTIHLRIGQQATLLQQDPLAPDPSVEGTSVDLVGVDNARASGRREWEVRAVASGRSVIEGIDGSRRFSFTVDVRR